MSSLLVSLSKVSNRLQYSSLNLLRSYLLFFNFLTPTSVELVTAPLTGDIIETKRVTKIDSREVDYTNGSVLREQELDRDSNQLFYLIQEGIGNVERTEFLSKFEMFV